jgi:hypothetical protein
LLGELDGAPADRQSRIGLRRSSQMAGSRKGAFGARSGRRPIGTKAVST